MFGRTVKLSDRIGTYFGFVAQTERKGNPGFTQGVPGFRCAPPGLRDSIFKQQPSQTRLREAIAIVAVPSPLVGEGQGGGWRHWDCPWGPLSPTLPHKGGGSSPSSLQHRCFIWIVGERRIAVL